MALAKINGMFRLTRDAETINTQSGTTITKLGLACSEKYKDKETQLFLDAVAFGKTGEILAQYAGTKGTQIFLSGKLQTESWEKDGQKRSKTTMTIESFDFVSSGDRQQAQSSQSYQQQPQQQQSYQQPKQQQSQQMPSSNTVPEIDIDEDEIPFNEVN